MGCCRSVDSVDCCRNEHLVCTCMGVMYSEICQAIDEGATSFEGLSDQLMVGTGCSSCIQEVHEILEKKTFKK